MAAALSLAGEVPASGDQAGLVEGALLVMACWCTVLASGLLSPVLPQIAARYAALPHVEILVGFVATIPALSVAVLAVPMGWLGDVLGQRRVLLAGLALYGLAGIVPFWLDDIAQIILARALVGVGEAAVMTTSTALLGLRFSGRRRGRWLAAQVASANILGIFVMISGGFLGLLDWHAPFLAYGFAWLLLIPSLLALRSPQPAGSTVRQQPGEHDRGAGPLRDVDWPRVTLICGLNLLSTLGMFVIVVQAAFLLPERGGANSAEIGVGIACGASGVAIGAVLSGAFAHIVWWRRAAPGFAVMGAGFLCVAATSGFWATGAMLALAGLGAGAIIPALLAALVMATAPGKVGRVVGLWTAATFMAQFLNPPLFVLLRQQVHTQSGAIGWVAAVMLMTGVMLWLGGSRRQASGQDTADRRSMRSVGQGEKQ